MSWADRFMFCNCDSLGSNGVRQLVQMRRTSRWARTANSVDEIRKGSTPMSTIRVTAPEASLVCKVDNTK